MNIWYTIGILLLINLVFLEIIDDPIECLDYDSLNNDYFTDYSCMKMLEIYSLIELVSFFLIPLFFIIGFYFN